MVKDCMSKRIRAFKLGDCDQKQSIPAIMFHGWYKSHVIFKHRSVLLLYSRKDKNEKRNYIHQICTWRSAENITILSSS
ncbi:hypothetical protein OPV22_013536 [Ensete ventricosum]|uniref:Uncharacterized protein n=1 Tax=Ensete ventricosum TaxID=4639 RepID=A0AAV8R8I6_ENSVE|nr:hypothetical protein OPV22_013536 [Ensete ventricosum]